MSNSVYRFIPAPPPPQTPADRIRELQDEARTLAREHIEQLTQALHTVTRLSGEIAAGGELYPVGIREECRRLADDLPARVLRLTAIVGRS